MLFPVKSYVEMTTEFVAFLGSEGFVYPKRVQDIALPGFNTKVSNLKIIESDEA